METAGFYLIFFSNLLLTGNGMYAFSVVNKIHHQNRATTMCNKQKGNSSHTHITKHFLSYAGVFHFSRFQHRTAASQGKRSFPVQGRDNYKMFHSSDLPCPGNGRRCHIKIVTYIGHFIAFQGICLMNNTLQRAKPATIKMQQQQQQLRSTTDARQKEGAVKMKLKL